MAYPTLNVGTNGEETKKLQNALIGAGYNLGSAGADGIYGNLTRAAVKKYQTDNGLTADGIAGNQTLSKLYGTGASQPTPQQTKPAMKAYDPSTDASYQQAMQVLQSVNSGKPSYAGTHDAPLKDIYDKITGREPFRYDVATDPDFKAYAEQYMKNGRLAMTDTMGQAAGLTGGYGSSYAQSVGQQAFDGYLQRLNEVIPALSQQAYGRYQDEGNRMSQQYAMLGDLRDVEYRRYQDSYNRFADERSYAQGIADQAYNRGNTAWQQDYQLDRDQQSRADSERSYLLSLISSAGYSPTDAELAASGITRDQANALIAKYNEGQRSGVYYGGDQAAYADNSDPNLVSSNYGYVNYVMNNARANGVSTAEIANQLKNAVELGYITDAEAAEIKKKSFQLGRVK